jgi:hypothetical protein
VDGLSAYEDSTADLDHREFSIRDQLVDRGRHTPSSAATPGLLMSIDMRSRYQERAGVKRL